MTTLILIGGHSSRMGRDKALIERPDGRRQIDWLVELARPAGGEVVLSMREHSPPPLALPVIVDSHREAGPLAALASFYAHRPGEAALVLSCDLFLLDAETVRHLLAGRDPARLATCFSNRLDGLPEPLCAIYEAAALARAGAWLEEGGRGARAFLRALHPLTLDLPHPVALDSVNTPEELAESFSKLRRGVAEKTVAASYPGSPGVTPIVTLANTVAGLFEELRFRHRLPSLQKGLEPLKNGYPCGWETELAEGDRIEFSLGR